MNHSTFRTGLSAAILAAEFYYCLLPVNSAAQPVITNTAWSSGGIVLSGTGGEPDGTYRVLASPDFSLAVTNWPAISTNDFDSSGNFSSTNPILPGSIQAYYSIQTIEEGIDFGLIGYAEGTTGGAGGATVTADTAAEFETYAESTGSLIIMVDGSLSIGTVNVASDKTIVGVDGSATIIGNLKLDSVSNVIVRNLNISNPTGGDGITIQDFSHHVWIDHCSFGNCSDGQLDITHGSDFITASWCTFSYTLAQTSHRFSSLVGHDENNAAEDAGRLHITYHHNWWGFFVHERTPRVRFGRIHTFNNYFYSPGNNYCIRASIQSQVLSENNYFKQVDEPYDKYIELSETGLIKSLNNIFDNCQNVIPYNDTVFTPPYSYTLDTASDVPTLVTGNAGAGQGPFAP